MSNIKNLINYSQDKKAVITTYEGGVAYKTSLEDDLCTIFTLGCFQSRFYETAQEAITDIGDILHTALEECPELATKYAIYSAETLKMKLMPTLWLVYLSSSQDKTLFKKAFPRIIGRNIKLIHNFVDICRNTNIRPGGHMSQKIKNNNRGIGSGVKKVINNHLNSILNDYNATRFAGKLEDICRLTRIKDTDETQEYLQYIFKPHNADRRLTFPRAVALKETIDILNNLSTDMINGSTDATDINGTIDSGDTALNVALNNISKYYIQMEEIKFTFGKLPKPVLQKIYRQFIPSLSYAALIINLVAIERVFSDDIEEQINYRNISVKRVNSTNIPSDIVDIVATKIRDYEAYKRSGLFFMRLYSASKLVLTREWTRAMNEVFLQAAKDTFKDVTCSVIIAADTSGSMSSCINNSSVHAIDIASYLTAACAISIKKLKAYAIATNMKQVPIKTDNVEVEADRIKSVDVGYGTNFSKVLNNYNNEDFVIIITDMQQADDIEQNWKNLRKKNNAKFIFWDVMGYVGHNLVGTDPSFLYLRGYSDNNLSVISNLLQGKAGQKEIVNQVEI